MIVNFFPIQVGSKGRLKKGVLKIFKDNTCLELIKIIFPQLKNLDNLFTQVI